MRSTPLLIEATAQDGYVVSVRFEDGTAGEWQIQVAPDANASPPHPYAYDLAIQGFSGLGPVNPSPVPEPSTWAMAFVGFAGLGLMGFRRAGRARARPLPVRL